MHGLTASPKCKIRKMSPSLKSETVLIWFDKKSPRLDHEDLPSSIFLRFLFFSKFSLFSFLFFFSFLYSWLTQKSLPKIKNICRRVYKYQMRRKNVRNTIATIARATSFAWKFALMYAPKLRSDQHGVIEHSDGVAVPGPTAWPKYKIQKSAQSSSSNAEQHRNNDIHRHICRRTTRRCSPIRRCQWVVLEH